MRRILLLTMVLLIMLPSARGEGVTLKTVSTFAGDDAAAETYIHLLRSWEEKTGNRVVDFSAPSDEKWKTGILLDFAAGNEADVLFYFTGTADNAPILSRVVPIAEIRQAYPQADLPESENCREADGKIYAIPVREYWEGLFCNADLFAQYGLELPTDWDKLERAIAVFRENHVVPIAVSLSDVPHYIAEFCILACAGPREHALRPETGGDVPSGWVEGMALLRRLYALGAFPENVNSTTASVTSRMFVEKKAAMQLDGSWFANGLPAENMESTVVLPFPAYARGADTAVIRGVSMGFYLSRRAFRDELRRDAAVDLLACLATGENARALGGYTFEGRLRESAEHMLHASPEILAPIQDDMNQEARTLWFSLIPQVAEGEVEPEEMWTRVMALHPFSQP